MQLSEIGVVASHGAITFEPNQEVKVDITRALQTLNAMIFLRAVDNFQSYIVDLLLEIFDQRPEIVPKGSLNYRDLFKYSDVEELRKIAIQRVVLGYSYQNSVDLSDDIAKQLNFIIFPSKLSRLRVKRFLEIRNIVVHNRGVTNEPFMERCGSKADKVGIEILIPHGMIAIRYFDWLANNVDGRACHKFLPARVISK